MRTMIAAVGASTLTACASTSWSDEAVDRLVERAEMCEHWMGEEPYDAPRRAEIKGNLRDLRCATVRRDGEALKVSRRTRPEDLRRIDEALAGF